MFLALTHIGLFSTSPKTELCVFIGPISIEFSRLHQSIGLFTYSGSASKMRLCEVWINIVKTLTCMLTHYSLASLILIKTVYINAISHFWTEYQITVYLS